PSPGSRLQASPSPAQTWPPPGYAAWASCTGPARPLAVHLGLLPVTAASTAQSATGHASHTPLETSRLPEVPSP
ncbi:collagen alpha-4(IV) chain-like, partial [Daubentonia madagascariensis]